MKTALHNFPKPKATCLNDLLTKYYIYHHEWLRKKPPQLYVWETLGSKCLACILKEWQFSRCIYRYSSKPLVFSWMYFLLLLFFFIYYILYYFFYAVCKRKVNVSLLMNQIKLPSFSLLWQRKPHCSNADTKSNTECYYAETHEQNVPCCTKHGQEIVMTVLHKCWINYGNLWGIGLHPFATQKCFLSLPNTWSQITKQHFCCFGLHACSCFLFFF